VTKAYYNVCYASCTYYTSAFFYNMIWCIIYYLCVICFCRRIYSAFVITKKTMVIIFRIVISCCSGFCPLEDKWAKSIQPIYKYVCVCVCGVLGSAIRKKKIMNKNPVGRYIPYNIIVGFKFIELVAHIIIYKYANYYIYIYIYISVRI